MDKILRFVDELFYFIVGSSKVGGTAEASALMRLTHDRCRNQCHWQRCAWCARIQCNLDSELIKSTSICFRIFTKTSIIYIKWLDRAFVCRYLLYLKRFFVRNKLFLHLSIIFFYLYSQSENFEILERFNIYNCKHY